MSEHRLINKFVIKFVLKAKDTGYIVTNIRKNDKKITSYENVQKVIKKLNNEDVIDIKQKKINLKNGKKVVRINFESSGGKEVLYVYTSAENIINFGLISTIKNQDQVPILEKQLQEIVNGFLLDESK
jgi:hypothetical protein